MLAQQKGERREEKEIKDERCARTNAAGVRREKEKEAEKGRRDYAMIEYVVRAMGRRRVREDGGAGRSERLVWRWEREELLG